MIRRDRSNKGLLLFLGLFLFNLSVLADEGKFSPSIEKPRFYLTIFYEVSPALKSALKEEATHHPNSPGGDFPFQTLLAVQKMRSEWVQEQLKMAGPMGPYYQLYIHTIQSLSEANSSLEAARAYLNIRPGIDLLMRNPRSVTFDLLPSSEKRGPLFKVDVVNLSSIHVQVPSASFSNSNSQSAAALISSLSEELFKKLRLPEESIAGEVFAEQFQIAAHKARYFLSDSPTRVEWDQRNAFKLHPQKDKYLTHWSSDRLSPMEISKALAELRQQAFEESQR